MKFPESRLTRHADGVSDEQFGRLTTTTAARHLAGIVGPIASTPIVATAAVGVVGGVLTAAVGDGGPAGVTQVAAADSDGPYDDDEYYPFPVFRR